MKSVLPSLPEAEASAVECLLNGASPDAFPLREEHFADETCRLAFCAVRALADARAPVNVQSVTLHLRAHGMLDKAGGPHPITELSIKGSGVPANLDHYFESLELARQRRTAVALMHQALPELCAHRLDAPAFAEELAARCAPLSATAGHTAAAIAAEIEADTLAGTAPDTFPTGLAPLDVHLRGGLHRGEMAVVAGETGAGKSALLIQAAAACAEAERPVIYFSLEMPRRDVFNRIAAALGDHRPGSGGFNRAQCRASALPVTIHDDIAALADIAAAIRTTARTGKAALAVVDYLQLVEAPGDTRELAMSETARRLKTLALREKIAVLTASQLNDDGRLRESRSIGHHADIVLGILGGIEVRKFRRGAANATIPATLDGAASRFNPA